MALSLMLMFLLLGDGNDDEARIKRRRKERNRGGGRTKGTRKQENKGLCSYPRCLLVFLLGGGDSNCSRLSLSVVVTVLANVSSC